MSAYKQNRNHSKKRITPPPPPICPPSIQRNGFLGIGTHLVCCRHLAPTPLPLSYHSHYIHHSCLSLSLSSLCSLPAQANGRRRAGDQKNMDGPLPKYSLNSSHHPFCVTWWFLHIPLSLLCVWWETLNLFRHQLPGTFLCSKEYASGGSKTFLSSLFFAAS
jgi:hypothetical protein